MVAEVDPPWISYHSIGCPSFSRVLVQPMETVKNVGTWCEYVSDKKINNEESDLYHFLRLLMKLLCHNIGKSETVQQFDHVLNHDEYEL